MAPPTLKVCCIASIEEARIAIGAGAAAIGLVGAMPSGPGVIDDGTIADIARAVGDAAWTVLLTSRTFAAGVCEHVAATGVNAVQIVDDPEPGTYPALRRLAPAPRIVQVIHVEDEGAVDAARRAAEGADVILLDSGRPKAATKVLGGTGMRHDWRISRAIVDAVERPVFLAVGIRPENVAEAIRDVGPAGIDLCTGVRRDGALDPVLLRDLVDRMSA